MTLCVLNCAENKLPRNSSPKASPRQIIRSRGGGHAQVGQAAAAVAGPLVLAERAVAHRIDAAVDAMHQRVAQAGPIELGARNVPLANMSPSSVKRHAHRVALRAAKHFQIDAVGPAARDQRRRAL